MSCTTDVLDIRNLLVGSYQSSGYPKTTEEVTVTQVAETLTEAFVQNQVETGKVSLFISHS